MAHSGTNYPKVRTKFRRNYIYETLHTFSQSVPEHRSTFAMKFRKVTTVARWLARKPKLTALSDPARTAEVSTKMKFLAESPEPCKTHPDGTRYHLLDCRHLIETKDPQPCGANCMGVSKKRKDSVIEVETLPAAFSCPKCSTIGVNWAYMSFDQIRAHPSYERKYGESSPELELENMKEWVGLCKSKHKVRLWGGRLCEAVLATDVSPNYDDDRETPYFHSEPDQKGVGL